MDLTDKEQYDDTEKQMVMAACHCLLIVHRDHRHNFLQGPDMDLTDKEQYDDTEKQMVMAACQYTRGLVHKHRLTGIRTWIRNQCD